MSVYRGFSSESWITGKRTFTVTDADCIKVDLMNHLTTRYGERRHAVGFGTRIPDLPFDPNDESTIAIIKEDILEVINHDPRVQLISCDLYSLPNDNTVVADVKILYVELGIEDTIQLDLSRFNKLPA